MKEGEMAHQANQEIRKGATVSPARACGIAGICLAAGLAAGYVLPGWQELPWPRQTSAHAASTTDAPSVPPGARVPGADTRTLSGVHGVAGAPVSPHSGAMSAGGHMPSLEEMKQMADKQAEPLLAKLKSDPKNAALLVQVGAIYHSTHQFDQAAVYYGKAVDADPRNVATRTKFAISLFRKGDVDGSIAQLNAALKYDNHDANALFNLGMIRLQGKQDGKGAIAAWQRLLKTNPNLDPSRKAAVQKAMAEVATTLGNEHEGVRTNGQAIHN